jgi:hypothetical protein
MAGYFLTGRAEIAIDEGEPPVKVTIDSPEKLRIVGDLVHLDNVAFRHKGAAKPLLENVTLTVEQGGRCAFVGAVSERRYVQSTELHSEELHRTDMENRHWSSSSWESSHPLKAQSCVIP